MKDLFGFNFLAKSLDSTDLVDAESNMANVEILLPSTDIITGTTGRKTEPPMFAAASHANTLFPELPA